MAKPIRIRLREGFFLAMDSNGSWNWFGDLPYFRGHYYGWSAKTGNCGRADCFEGLPNVPSYAWKEHLYRVVNGELVRVDLKENPVEIGNNQ